MAIPPYRSPSDDAPLVAAAQAASLRDAGVRRVRSATRWLAAGAVALTGVLAGVAAHDTAASASGTVAAQGGGTTGAAEDGNAYGYDDGGEGDDEAYDGAPQAPAQAPRQAPQQVAPSASSGAS